MNLLSVLCGLVGLPTGWFVAVVARRVPERQRLTGPATCPACASLIGSSRLGGTLAPRNRCHSCGASLGVPHQVVEVLTGALFAAAGSRFGLTWALPAFCVFFAALVAVSAVDLVHFIIPNRIVYPALVTCAALLVPAAFTAGGVSDLVHAAIGGAAAFGTLLVIHLISPRGMGFGDVRLAAVIGMMLGFLGERYVFLGLFLAFLLASVVGLGLMAARRRGRKDAVPFGPFLAGGAVAASLWGAAILDAYGHGRG